MIPQLRELEAKATPAPWFAEPLPRDADGWSTCAGVAGVGGGKSGMIYAKPPGGVFPASDKALIIALRNNAALLLAALEAAWALVEGLDQEPVPPFRGYNQWRERNRVLRNQYNTTRRALEKQDG